MQVRYRTAPLPEIVKRVAIADNDLPAMRRDAATELRHYSKLSTQIDDADHALPHACGMRYRTAPLP